MLCTVKNTSNRIRALESGSAGILVFVPGNSEGEYNLNPSALAMNGPTLAVAPVESTKIAKGEPALAVTLEPVPLEPVPSKAPSAKVDAKGSPPGAESPADWQKGLEAPK